MISHSFMGSARMDQNLYEADGPEIKSNIFWQSHHEWRATLYPKTSNHLKLQVRHRHEDPHLKGMFLHVSVLVVFFLFALVLSFPDF